eukprot:6190262-Pleurochrysis_carterae.AAC.5
MPDSRAVCRIGGAISEAEHAFKLWLNMCALTTAPWRGRSMDWSCCCRWLRNTGFLEERCSIACACDGHPLVLCLRSACVHNAVWRGLHSHGRLHT